MTRVCKKTMKEQFLHSVSQLTFLLEVVATSAGAAEQHVCFLRAPSTLNCINGNLWEQSRADS